MTAIDDLPAQITAEQANVQEWGDGTGPEAVWTVRRNQAHSLYNTREASSQLDWGTIAYRDLFDALVEPDPADVRPLLLTHVARLCIWIDQIDARAE